MKQGEGYLVIDDRVSGGKLVEAATMTCSHCQRQLIRNPERTRPRAWCGKCDRYICDQCDLIQRVNGGDCVPFAAVIDKVLDRAAHSIGRG